MSGAKYPAHVIRTLRQRRGLDEKDPSQDAEITEMSPARAMEEILTWELGNSGWFDQIKAWAEDCGLEIKAK